MFMVVIPSSMDVCGTCDGFSYEWKLQSIGLLTISDYQEYPNIPPIPRSVATTYIFVPIDPETASRITQTVKTVRF